MALSEEEAKSIAQTLTSQPSESQLADTLRRFLPFSNSVTRSSGSIAFTLVNTTIPELWSALKSNEESEETVALITSCLSSISGVNALLVRLHQLHGQMRHLPDAKGGIQVEEILEVLTRILEEGDSFSPARAINLYSQDQVNGKFLLNEYMSLVVGSKILNTASRICLDMSIKKDFWISDGKRYSKWLGGCLGLAIKSQSGNADVSPLFGKSLNLGYPSQLPPKDFQLIIS